MEAEVTAGGEAEVSLASCSGQSCSCLCHLQRPGMMLIWVPVEVESAGDKKNDVKKQTTNDAKNVKKNEEAEPGGTVDVKAKDETENVSAKEKPGTNPKKSDCQERLDFSPSKDEASSPPVKEKQGTKPKIPDYQDCLPSKDEASSPPVKDKNGTKQKKSNFHEQLNGLLANHHSLRISEPGAQATNNYYESSLSKSAPSPPAVQELTSQEEEENIYELHLPVPEHFPKKILVANDLLKFSKSHASVDPKPGLDDTPPARPPKIHIMSGTVPPCRPPPPPPLSPSSKRDHRKLNNIFLNQTGLGLENLFMFSS